MNEYTPTPGLFSGVPRTLINVFAVIVTVLAAATLLSKVLDLVERQPAYNPRTINITAEGKVTASPDIAMVNASVVTDGNTAEAAQSQNTQKMNKVIEYVKSLGVDAKDVKTQDYSVYPQYNYANGKNDIVGYTASQTLNIKVRDLQNVGKILDGVTQNGANQIQNVYYSFENPDDLRQEAREMALASAKEKAEKLTGAAGVKLGKLTSFTENGSSSGPMPYYDARSMEGGMGGAPVAQSMVEPGVQDITASVNVTFELE